MSTQIPLRKTNAGREHIFCELRGDYRAATPEEIVRQEYIYHLHHHYGYAFEQMDQERKTQHGRRSPRADIVIYQSAADKQANKAPVIVVECKSDNVTIIESDYWQGESYARAIGCELFVTHNNKQTRFFKLVPGLPGQWADIEDIPRAADWGDARKLAASRRRRARSTARSSGDCSSTATTSSGMSIKWSEAAPSTRCRRSSSSRCTSNARATGAN